MTVFNHQIHLQKTAGGSVFNMVVRGRLDKEDYNEFVPQLEWQITYAGKISLLIELIDFRGWTPPAFWEDIKFAVKHFDDIDKIAVIGGGNPWERGMTSFFKPFTRAKVRFFTAREKQKARAWIEGN
jgi:SpoIIAA-like